MEWEVPVMEVLDILTSCLGLGAHKVITHNLISSDLFSFKIRASRILLDVLFYILITSSRACIFFFHTSKFLLDYIGKLQQHSELL